MEPITTAIMIGGIVKYLGKRLDKDNTIEGFFSDLTAATVDWIRPLLLEEDKTTPKEVIQKLQEKTNSEAKQAVIRAIIAGELEDSPELESKIRALYNEITKTEEGGNIVSTIRNSKNVVVGTINSGGGNISIGDSGTKV